MSGCFFTPFKTAPCEWHPRIQKHLSKVHENGKEGRLEIGVDGLLNWKITALTLHHYEFFHFANVPREYLLTEDITAY